MCPTCAGGCFPIGLDTPLGPSASEAATRHLAMHMRVFRGPKRSTRAFRVSALHGVASGESQNCNVALLRRVTLSAEKVARAHPAQNCLRVWLLPGIQRADQGPTAAWCLSPRYRTTYDFTDFVYLSPSQHPAQGQSQKPKRVHCPSRSVLQRLRHVLALGF